MVKTGRGATDVIDKISEQTDAQTGTQLGPHLLAEARLAIGRAQEAKSAGRWQDEIGPTITAILCAHAAVEATVNTEANRLDPVWFGANERLSLEDKWSWVVQRMTGRSPAKGRGPGQRLKRLCADRNLIAHFKGVPQANGRTSVMGPPVRSRGGKTRVRVYFDASRAEGALANAQSAISSISAVGP